MLAAELPDSVGLKSGSIRDPPLIDLAPIGSPPLAQCLIALLQHGGARLDAGHQAGYLRPQAMGKGLDGGLDGTLRRCAVFEEKGLVNMPKNLDFVEASTLTCAAVTAWNAL